MSEHGGGGASHHEHGAKESSGEGVGKIATIFSPEGILMGMGQDLVAKPGVKVLLEDGIVTTGTKIMTEALSGGNPVEGGGSGGGH